MAVLNVAPGQSIQDAVNAAAPGDTIDVQAGNYVDQFLTIEQSVTLQAVGGEVVMTEDTQPPDGKAMITEGQDGISVAINGFDISGVTVDDGNGAAIRYEGGNLSLAQDYFHNNQDGILAASDPSGSITIDDSEFAFNGNGQGNTHDIYINDVGSFTITNSYIHDADVGHEIKSRAENTTIENNRIFDNNSSASYDIDLPDGGNATISGNVIEQGPNTQNPYMITYGVEESGGARTNAGTDVTISGNTIVNDLGGGGMLLNFTSVAPVFSDNSVYGLTEAQLSPKGPVDDSGTVFLASRPTLDTSSLVFINPPAGGSTGTGGGDGTGTGTGGGTGAGGGGDTGGSGGSPPPPPPPTLTLDDYHTMVGAEFTAYAAANPSVWLNSQALTAIVGELTSTTVLTTPLPGDLWST